LTSGRPPTVPRYSSPFAKALLRNLNYGNINRVRKLVTPISKAYESSALPINREPDSTILFYATCSFNLIPLPRNHDNAGFYPILGDCHAGRCAQSPNNHSILSGLAPFFKLCLVQLAPDSRRNGPGDCISNLSVHLTGSTCQTRMR
jgi:hypothetical protein